MQVLWSRAAQTRSLCRCRSCLNSANTIARRATTGIPKRRLKAGDLLTACYSTIIGAAVFVDGRVKEDRRKQWDRAIQEAKAGTPLREPQYLEPKNTKDRPGATKEAQRFTVSEGDEFDRTAMACAPIPAVWNGSSWMSRSETQTPPLETQLTILESHLKQSLHTSTEAVTRKEAIPPHGVAEDEWTDEILESAPTRDPQSRLHLDKMEEMVAKLVSQLLLRTGTFSSLSGTSNPANTDLLWQLREISGRLEGLRCGTTRLPAYSILNSQSVKEERLDLNKSMVLMFEKTAPGDGNIDLTLAKICYNLLISTAPPSITTYNILIGSLTRLGQPELAQVVVDSFLYDSRFRPNSKTVRLVLDHYTAKKDAAGFKSIVARMRSADGDMRVRRRAVDSLCYPPTAEWARANKVIHRNGCLSQKTPRSSNIFDSLIRGCLEMTSVMSAIRYVRAALREGQEVKSETLRDVVKTCLAQLDYRAAKSLLFAILSQWEGNSIPSAITYSSDVRYAIHQLLSLCGVDPSPNSEQKLPIKSSRDALQSMLRYMRLESIKDAIDQFANRILSVQSALGFADPAQAETVGIKYLATKGQDREDEYVEDSLSQNAVGVTRTQEISIAGVRNALHILRKAAKLEQRRIKNREQSAAQARMIRLQVLESKLATEAERIIAKEANLISILYHRLPEELQMKYDATMRASCSTSISSRLALLSGLGREEVIEKRAKVAESIDERVVANAEHISPKNVAPAKQQWRAIAQTPRQQQLDEEIEEAYQSEDQPVYPRTSEANMSRRSKSYGIQSSSPIILPLLGPRFPSRNKRPMLPLPPQQEHTGLSAAAG